jgi:hypothetical protein
VYEAFDPSGSFETVYVISALQKDGRVIETAPFTAMYVPDLGQIPGFAQSDAVRTSGSTNGLIESKEVVVTDETLKTEIASSQLAPNPSAHIAAI